MHPILALLPLLSAAQDCREGIALFEKGYAAGARALLAQAASSAHCLKALGVTYAAAGDYRSAEPHFARACQLDRNEPDACYYWARALYSLDRFEESLAALNQGGASKPWWIAVARGQALDALSKPEAEAELKRAVELRRRDPAAVSEPDPLLSLAAFLYRQGRSSEALALLLGMRETHVHLPAYHFQVGRALAQSGEWARAAESLRRAVELRPSYGEAHGLLSRCYFRLGQDGLGARHQALARAR